ncbi:Hcp1 family type VI secretion system effector [Loktanella sp. D2R18]|uniref:Hcp family type VI secretion system effector n=1 Tax=Rhodobacterales TaxID=204455 RepID=UPI000DEACCB4|nr:MULTISPECIES: type VI secretion system tube protein Hcp [Rhodobacterales]MDO6590541.1 type VI secretion system tube protein Hcp [Yoonia sp. 1_MG-2023]RBW41258.1 Hcp1 family type VI secretion system effector [Loktanella sp. D2R18]
MAFDTFLYFPNQSLVVGESLDAEMSKKKAFEISDFSFGVENTVNLGSGSGGAGSGKANFSEFEVNKLTDTGSCGLFATCCTGNHFDEAIVELRRAGGSNNKSGTTFIKIHFKMVIVTEMTWNGADGEDGLNESVKFKYGALRIEYFKQNEKGVMSKAPGGQGEAKWSQILNEANYSVKR